MIVNTDLIKTPDKSKVIKSKLIAFVIKTPLQILAVFGIGFLCLIGLLWYKFPRTLTVKEEVIVRDTVFSEPETKLTEKVKRIRSPRIRTSSSSIENKKKEPKKVEEVKRNNLGYSRYEMIMWCLKKDENFRKNAYPDGKYYSIGYGFNMHPDNKTLLRESGNLHLINGWGKGATTTKENALKLTQLYIDKIIFPQLPTHYNANQQAAMTIKAYNTGNVKLGPCCGGRKGCGKGLKVHTQRRLFEVRLFAGQVKKQEWELIRKAAEKVDHNKSKKRRR
jgi:GH24 family phage-related lysozyme (muramidase)